jgi:hypothetical protein
MSKQGANGNLNPYTSNPEQWPPPLDVLIVGGGGCGTFQPVGGDTSGGGGGEVRLYRNFIPQLGSSNVITGVGGIASGWPGLERARGTGQRAQTSGGQSSIFGLVAQGGIVCGSNKNGVQGHKGVYVPEFDIYGTNTSNALAPATNTGGYGWFGGGGGGAGAPATPGIFGLGGIGGGTAGAGQGQNAPSAPGDYVAGTGGGGGAGNPGGNSAPDGGPGFGAIRYPANYANVSLILGTFATRQVNGYKYYSFDYGSAGGSRNEGNTIVF